MDYKTNKFRYCYSRFAMYEAIQKYFDKNPQKGKDVLVVGDTLQGKGGNPSITDMLLSDSNITCPDFPEVDIQKTPYPDNSFDYVISDQVLEHVKKPWVAVEETYRILKSGGITITTSCLLNFIHGIPNDYFRFTPDGLRSLFENYSKIHACSGHGNLDFVHTILNSNRRLQVNHPNSDRPGDFSVENALKNDKKNLYTVWIIAEK